MMGKNLKSQFRAKTAASAILSGLESTECNLRGWEVGFRMLVE